MYETITTKNERAARYILRRRTLPTSAPCPHVAMVCFTSFSHFSFIFFDSCGGVLDD